MPCDARELVPDPMKSARSEPGKKVKPTTFLVLVALVSALWAGSGGTGSFCRDAKCRIWLWPHLLDCPSSSKLA